MYYYLMYVSYATEPMDRSALTKLLETCRENNKKLDVTGMLFYIDGKFLQVLEDKKDAVNEIFGRIRMDTRHRKVSVMIEGNIKKRNFDAWYMSFRSFSARQFEKLSGFKNLETFFEKNPVTDESHVTRVFMRLFFNKYYKPLSVS